VAGSGLRFRPRGALDARDGLKSGVDRPEHEVNVVPYDLNRRDTHAGDQADEHPVLDEGRAVFVLGKTSKQFTHLNKSFGVDEDDWLGTACPVAGIGATKLQPKTKQYMLN